MFYHFSQDLFKFLEKKLLQSLIILSIWRFGVDGSDIFFAISSFKGLRCPVNHEDIFKEGVCCLCYSGYIASNEAIDGKLNDGRQFSADEDSAGVVKEESFVHPHEIVKKIAEPLYLLYFVHVTECDIAEIWVKSPEVVVVGGIYWKYCYSYLN